MPNHSSQADPLGQSIDAYLERCERGARPGAALLVAASPLSPIAAPLWRRLRRLKAAGCEIKAVFGRQALAEAKDELAEYVRAFGAEEAHRSCLIARFQGSNQLVEQLVLGQSSCWMGGEVGAGARQAPIQTCSPKDATPGVAKAAYGSFRFVQSMANPLKPSEIRRLTGDGRGWMSWLRARTSPQPRKDLWGAAA